MSHYFSRVRLLARPHDAALIQALSRQGAAYRDHALVWKLFPGDGAARDFVFRAQVGDDGGVTYYVVSRRPPQPAPGLFSVQTKPYAPLLQQDEVVRFDLRANPTVSRRGASGSSRRHDVLMDAKRSAVAEGKADATAIEAAGLQWLLARAAGWGLEIAPDSVLQSGYQQHRLQRKGSLISYASLDYLGLAQVIDPMALQQALCEGVGHAKGFGCGLLLVRRPG